MQAEKEQLIDKLKEMDKQETDLRVSTQYNTLKHTLLHINRNNFIHCNNNSCAVRRRMISMRGRNNTS